jgi:hypothetical protein
LNQQFSNLKIPFCELSIILFLEHTGLGVGVNCGTIGVVNGWNWNVSIWLSTGADKSETPKKSVLWCPVFDPKFGAGTVWIGPSEGPFVKPIVGWTGWILKRKKTKQKNWFNPYGQLVKMPQKPAMQRLTVSRKCNPKLLVDSQWMCRA